jgi:hypothetical protein
MHILHFDCCVCLETKDEDIKQVRLIRDDLICSECVPAAIIRPFEAALRHEINYPPKWGSTTLDLEKFLDLFTKEFVRAWAVRIKEYETPVQDRIYCQQRVLVGGAHTGSADTESCSICRQRRVPVDVAHAGSAETEVCNNFVDAGGYTFTAQCWRCGSWSCVECHSIVLAPPQDDEHFCSDILPEDNGSFDAATRGTVWQECPNHACLVKIALGSGCNAMRCHFCSTQFCMICGHKATPNSGHWTRQQGCPRWGELDAANSIFDDPAPEILDIVVGMAMLPPTDPHIPVIATLSNGNGAHSDEQTLREVREDLDLEIPGLQWAAGGNGTVLELIDDMRELLHGLACNLEWAASEWDRRDPVVRLATLLDPVHEAVESVNFIIRHEILHSRFLETLRANLDLAGPSASTVLVRRRTDILWAFAQYLRLHQPRVAESVLLFVSQRDSGRTLWVRDRVHRRA